VKRILIFILVLFPLQVIGSSQVQQMRNFVESPQGVAEGTIIRIEAVLIPYEKSTSQHEIEIFGAHKPRKGLHYILRAELEKLNHFYIENFHIEASFFDVATDRIKVQFVVTQRHGNQIEETIGRFIKEGIIVNDPTYTTEPVSKKFLTTHTQIFKNQNQEEQS
jgi:hypothetical protein